MIDCLPSTYGALGSISSKERERRRDRGRDRGRRGREDAESLNNLLIPNNALGTKSKTVCFTWF